MKRTLHCMRGDCGFRIRLDEKGLWRFGGLCPDCSRTLGFSEAEADRPVDSGVQALLSQRLPWPLSLPYQGLLAAGDEEIEAPLAALRHSLSRMTLFLLSAEYLAKRQEEATSESAVVAQLRDLFLAPSDAEPGPEILSSVVGALGDALDASEGSMAARLLEAWEETVAEFCASSAGGAAGSSRAAGEQAVAALGFLMRDEMASVERVSSEKGPVHVEYELMRGGCDLRQLFSAVSDIEVPAHHLFWWQSESGRLLDLYPLLVHQNCPGCGHRALFLWSGVSETGPYWHCLFSLLEDAQAPHRLAGGAPTRALRGRFTAEGEAAGVFAPRYLRLGAHETRRALPLWRGALLGGRYRVEEFIKRGASADIYRVSDEEADGELCMKAWPLDLVLARNALEEWTAATSASEGLQHDNVRAPVDSGIGGGCAYHVMPLLEGWQVPGGNVRAASLAELNVPDDEDLRVEIVRRIAEGLRFLHEHGLAHGHVKPSNVLLFEKDGRDEVCVCDAAFSLTDWPWPCSPLYVAPEQLLESEPANVRSDLYSLGVVFYQLVTGRVPGGRPLAIQTAAERVSSDVSPPSRHKLDISPEVEKIILDLLDPDPARRFASAEDLLARIEEWQKSRPGGRPDIRQSMASSVSQERERHVSVDEAQRLLGASIRDLDELVKAGGLTAARIGGKLMYPREQVDRLAAERAQRKKSAAPAGEAEDLPITEAPAGGNLLTAEQVRQTLGITREALDQMTRDDVITPVARDESGRQLFDAGAVFLLKRSPKPALDGEDEGEGGVISYEEVLRALNIDSARLDSLIAEGKLFAQRRGKDVYFHLDQFNKVRAEMDEEALMMSSGKKPTRGQQLFEAESEEDSSFFDSRLFHVEPSDQRGESPVGSEGLSPTDRTGVLQVDNEHAIAPETLMTVTETCRELKLSPGQVDMLVQLGHLRRLSYRGEPHYLLESVIELEERLEELLPVIRQQSRLCLRAVGGEPLKGRTIVLDAWQLAAGDEVVIGRLPAVDLPLIKDENLSRRHAAIRYPDRSEKSVTNESRRAVLQIRDLGSQNGTYIGDQQCRPGQWYDLGFDSIFRIGSTTFVVEPERGKKGQQEEDE